MAKTSPRNVGDLVFLESQKGLAIIIQDNWVKFIAHKELNETCWDISPPNTSLKT